MRIAEGVYLVPTSGPISKDGSSKVKDFKSLFKALTASGSPEAMNTSLGASPGGLSSQSLRSSNIAWQNSQCGCQKIKSERLPSNCSASIILPERSGSENLGAGSPIFRTECLRATCGISDFAPLPFDEPACAWSDAIRSLSISRI